MNVLLLSLGLTVSAAAQSQSTQTNYIKNARIQLEKDNELKLLEQLENQRLQEEKARMQRFESLNFSVSPQPTPSITTQSL